MKRRSRAGGEPVKTRRRKTVALKLRNAAKAVRRHSSSAAGQETKVARLTRELNEALQQQNATGDVLKVISRSTFDLQTVLTTLLESAARLCDSEMASISQRDGEVYRIAASFGYPTEYRKFLEEHPITPDRGTVTGRAVLEARVAHITDITRDPEYTRTEAVTLGSAPTKLGVPLLREGSPIGVMVLSRRRVEAFTERQIEVVKNFAAQAVIAIENARLLNELRQRTTDLTEALEQQTATSEVLQVISSASGDLEPVFVAMLRNAISICNCKFGNAYLWENNTLKSVVSLNTPTPFANAQARLSLNLGAKNPIARMIATKAVVHVHDEAASEAYAERDPRVVAAVELGGVRTLLVVPMLREGELIGGLTLARQEMRPFNDRQIALVESFAAQAVIAIENTRLLKELRERTDQLAAQSQELAKLNQQLEHRVTDQVGEIERMSRLRRFLPPQVADLIVASGAEKQLESHRREITALFCDLRGFTGFTESADAEDVIALLRDYHAAIGEIIIKYNGTLERYAGDGVMVVFNDPVPVENPALQAVLMALEVREAIGALTERWRRWGHDLGFGIGIAHGFATLGTIGFEGRFDYAAIGTVSNVASRLCDEAKPGQILISPRVLTKVENAVKVVPVGEFELKGIRRPIAAYNVVAIQSSEA